MEPAPKKAAKSEKIKWAKPADVFFDVSEHVDPEELDIKYDKLALDLNLQYGQVRPLDATHYEKQVEDFLSNPPSRLDLTVWKHPGVHTSPSHPHVSPLVFPQWNKSTTCWMASTSSKRPQYAVPSLSRTGTVAHRCGAPHTVAELSAQGHQWTSDSA